MNPDRFSLTVLPLIGRLECALHAGAGDGFRAMMEGVPIPIIQQQLGHVSLASTDTYLSHIAPMLVIETMGKREWSP